MSCSCGQPEVPGSGWCRPCGSVAQVEGIACLTSVVMSCCADIVTVAEAHGPRIDIEPVRASMVKIIMGAA